MILSTKKHLGQIRIRIWYGHGSRYLIEFESMGLTLSNSKPSLKESINAVKHNLMSLALTNTWTDHS